MKEFKHFTTVKGVSDRRRLPRLGKIRLGVKVRNRGGMTKKCSHGSNEGCMYCTHPTETPHFVCPTEVQFIYGEKPKSLDVMIPVEDPTVIFPQAYKYYGKSRGIKCIGDGETAYEAINGEMKERACPCEKLDKGCSLTAHLLVMLPRVNVGGVYQIDTGSYHSIVDINSGIDYIKALVGRVALVPAKLERVPRTTYGAGSAQEHYTLMLTPNMEDIGSLDMLRRDQRAIMAPDFAVPEPEVVNPAMNDDSVIDIKDEEDMESSSPREEKEGGGDNMEEFKIQSLKRLDHEAQAIDQIENTSALLKYQRERKGLMEKEMLPEHVEAWEQTIKNKMNSFNNGSEKCELL